MDIAQLGFGDHGVALVDAVLGAAIANKVFGGGYHMGWAKAVAGITLQAGDYLSGIGFDDFRVFGVALVGASPAIVAHYGQGGGKYPVYTCGRHFQGGGFANLAH